MNCYTNTSADYNTVELSNIEVPAAPKDAMGRAVYVATKLVQEGGLSKIQAAALAGVFLDENQCNPKSYMSKEKNGGGSKYTQGGGYGCGIGSWTGLPFKQQTLQIAGFPSSTKIENLTLDEQIFLLIKGNINGNSKFYYNALKRCTNIEDASATAQIIIIGVGRVSKEKWKTHPTLSDVKSASDKFGASNDRRYGKSDYHSNMFERRIKLGKQILEKLG